jgi:hypothetical protein
LLYQSLLGLFHHVEAIDATVETSGKDPVGPVRGDIVVEEITLKPILAWLFHGAITIYG